MIETEIYLINFKTNLQMTLRYSLRNTIEGFVSEREGKCLQDLLGDLLKETKEAKFCRAFYKPEG
jgi:hypothetical protein